MMQSDTVASIGGANVNHGMDVVGNGEADGPFHQSQEGLF